MIKRRKMRLNGEWQLDGRNQVYELKYTKPNLIPRNKLRLTPQSLFLAATLSAYYEKTGNNINSFIF